MKKKQRSKRTKRKRSKTKQISDSIRETVQNASKEIPSILEQMQGLRGPANAFIHETNVLSGGGGSIPVRRRRESKLNSLKENDLIKAFKQLTVRIDEIDSRLNEVENEVYE